MMSSRAFQLRDVQKTSFSRLLSLKRDKLAQWKVLILDAAAADILAPLILPSDLRRYGITLQLRIDAPRNPLPDVPVVYIVSPTPENVARILRDLNGVGSGKGKNARLYPIASLAFTVPAPRSLFKALAAEMQLPARISAVHDLYADYVALEQDLFSLNVPNSYVALNTPDDTAQARLLDRVATGIFSVLAGLGVIPIIRAQQGGASEAIARELDKRLRENIALFQGFSATGGTGGRMSSFRRPLLLLLDRDIDLNAMLHHTWTYQALVHDCLRMRLNAISLSVSDSGSERHGQKTHNLDKSVDPFWKANAEKPFPAVAEAIESALNKYRADVEAINRKAGGGSGGEGDASISQPGRSTAGHLASAISSLPELSKRKEAIDVHTNIATALLAQINARGLDAFFELETRVLAYASGAAPVRADAVALKEPLLQLLRGDGASSGTPADRLRAAAMYYAVFGAALAEADVREIRTALQEAGADPAVLEHVARVLGFVRGKPKENAYAGDESSRAKLRVMMSSVVHRGITAVSRFPKTLIGEQRRAFATARVLRLFMSEKARVSDAGADDVLGGYLYFDPKIESAEQNVAVWDIGGDGETETPERMARRKMRNLVFSDAIVFLTGGGNYVEYGNCVECVKEDLRGEGNVLYGCTEIVNPESFLNQVGVVARQGTREAS